MDEETGLISNVRNNVWTRRTPNQKTAILIGSVVLIALVIIGVSLGVTASTSNGSGDDDGGETTTIFPSPPSNVTTPLPPTTLPPITTTVEPTTPSQPSNETTTTPLPPPTTTTIEPNVTTTVAPTTTSEAPTTTTRVPDTTTTPAPTTTTPVPTTTSEVPTTTSEAPTTTSEAPTTTPIPTTTPKPTETPTQPPPTTPTPTAPPTTTTTEVTPGVVCETEVCKSEGERILKNMNLTADPCSDFYQYTCGGYEATHTLPDDKGRYGTFDEANDVLIKRLISLYEADGNDNETESLVFVRNTYRGCANKDKLNELGMNPLKAELNQLGGWPMAGIPYTSGGDYDFKEEMVKLLLLQESSLVSVSVQPDAFDTSKYTINLDQPSFGLGRTDLITSEKDPKAAKLVESYKEFIQKTVKLFNNEANDVIIKTKVDEVVNFEIKLANMSAAPEDRRDHFVITKKMTFEELNQKVEGFDWFELLKQVYELIAPEVRLTRDMDVIVNDIKYLQQLSQLLKELSIKSNKEVVANYLGWRYVQNNGYLTTNQFRQAEFEFDQVQKGVQKETDMKERCVNVLANVLPQLVGRSYVDTFFSEESKEAAEEIISKVIDSYRTEINLKEWMDKETKEKTIEKITKLKINTGYPDWIKHDDVLNKMYQFNSIADVDKAFESMKRISQVIAKNMFSKLLNPVDKDKEWPMGPAIVNAAYDPSQNSITIPAAILQLVFFNESRPNYLNYGAIGAVIGHEIGHGFDDEGSQFDADGNLKNWWTDETKNGFNSKAKCFIDQYSNIFDERANMSLNGRNTLGENIADNGGVHLAYKAYQLLRKEEGRLPKMEKYSSQEMFFISYANNWCNLIRDETLRSRILYDPHSPAKYRINVPVANFDTFGQLFKCEKGSKMRPNNQCVLW